MTPSLPISGAGEVNLLCFFFGLGSGCGSGFGWGSGSGSGCDSTFGCGSGSGLRFGLTTLISRIEYVATPCGFLTNASSLPSASQVSPGGATTIIASADALAHFPCVWVGLTASVPSGNCYLPFWIATAVLQVSPCRGGQFTSMRQLGAIGLAHANSKIFESS